MKSLYLVRYRMKGRKAINLFVTFEKSLPAALAAFHAYMGSQGAEFFQYEHLSHRDIPENSFSWDVHKHFLEQLPRDELIDFLECRAARQVKEWGEPDKHTAKLLNHFKVTVQ